MNLVFSMNIPSNNIITPSENNAETTTKIIKNVVLTSPISTYINNLSPYKKNIDNNFINQNNMMNMSGNNNNFYKNNSSMFQINNLYNKKCKTCDK